MKKIILFLAFLFIINLNAQYTKKEYDSYIIYETSMKFSDFVFTLKDEISQNGFLLSYEANIKKSIDGISKFYKKENLFLYAKKIGFCKSSLTLKMMEDSALNLMVCPLSIAIYQENKKDSKVKILYQLKKAINKNETISKLINKEIITIIENSLDN